MSASGIGLTWPPVELTEVIVTVGAWPGCGSYAGLDSTLGSVETAISLWKYDEPQGEPTSTSQDG